MAIYVIRTRTPRALVKLLNKGSRVLNEPEMKAFRRRNDHS